MHDGNILQQFVDARRRSPKEEKHGHFFTWKNQDFAEK